MSGAGTKRSQKSTTNKTRKKPRTIKNAAGILIKMKSNSAFNNIEEETNGLDLPVQRQGTTPGFGQVTGANNFMGVGAQQQFPSSSSSSNGSAPAAAAVGQQRTPMRNCHANTLVFENNDAQGHAMRVILDLSGTNIGNPDEAAIITENVNLTAYDIWKDATNTITPIKEGKPLLDEIIRRSFNVNTTAWPRKLAVIEEKRLFSDKTKVGVTNLCWLKPVKMAKRGGGSQAAAQVQITMPQNITFAALPNDVKLAVHDSGDDPRKISPNICVELNAGSAFDPASREKTRPMFVPTMTIPHKVFVLKGMDKLVESISFTPTYQSGTQKINTITITINFYVYSQIGVKQTYTFSSKRDANFNIVGDNTLTNGQLSQDPILNTVVIPATSTDNAITVKNTDFFGGNNEKNSWFNNNNNITDPNIIIGTLFVMCKELGDFLQGLLLHMYLGNTSDNRGALFTSDKVLATRCIQDKVDVIIQEPYDPNVSKNLGRAKYLTSTIDPNALLNAQKDSLIRSVEANNKIVIDDIQTIVDEKKYVIGGSQKNLTSEQRAFLESCITVLNERNSFCSGQMGSISNYENANTFASFCRATNFIGKGKKIKHSEKSLFKKINIPFFQGTIPANIKDPILENPLTKIFSTAAVTRGGVFTPSKKRGSRNIQKGGDGEYISEDPTVKVLLAIGRALSKREYKVFDDLPTEKNGSSSSADASTVDDGSSNSEVTFQTEDDILFNKTDEIEAIYSTLLPYFYYEGIQPYDENIFDDFFYIISSITKGEYDEEDIYDLTSIYEKSLDELSDIFLQLEVQYQKEKLENIHLFLQTNKENIENTTNKNETLGNSSSRSNSFAKLVGNTGLSVSTTNTGLSQPQGVGSLQLSSTVASDTDSLKGSQETQYTTPPTTPRGSQSGAPTSRGTPHSQPSPAAKIVRNELLLLTPASTAKKPENRGKKAAIALSFRRNLDAAGGHSENENNLGGGGKQQRGKKRVCKKTRKAKTKEKKRRQTKRRRA